VGQRKNRFKVQSSDATTWLPGLLGPARPTPSPTVGLLLLLLMMAISNRPLRYDNWKFSWVHGRQALPGNGLADLG